VKRRHRTLAAVLGSVLVAKGTLATASGKLEALVALAVVVTPAVVVGDQISDAQALLLWSVAGTGLGALLAGLHMPQGGWVQRAARAIGCFVAGILLAPWAIAWVPRASEGTPDWWHALAASGLAAAVSWVIISEIGNRVRERVAAAMQRRSSGGGS
jgi:hypothetical protein